jgi:hypothetical protein
MPRPRIPVPFEKILNVCMVGWNLGFGLRSLRDTNGGTAYGVIGMVFHGKLQTGWSWVGWTAIRDMGRGRQLSTATLGLRQLPLQSSLSRDWK